MVIFIGSQWMLKEAQVKKDALVNREYLLMGLLISYRILYALICIQYI